jgi:hypothetical protein
MVVLARPKGLDKSQPLRYTLSMNAILERIRNEARSLSPEERELLLLTMDYDLHGDISAEEAEVEAAWDEEIAKRVAEVQSGSTQLISSDEFFSVFAEARATLSRQKEKATV